MATHYSIRKQVAAPAPEIPDKLYFRIGDVARLLQVPAYVLRFWETEFPQLKPNKGGTGQRLYRKKDVEMALRIKSLLYDQGYTIPGARQVFKAEARPGEVAPGPVVAAVEAGVTALRPNALHRDKELAALRSELRMLQAMLAKTVSDGHPAAAGKVKAMPPRLVLEPKAEAKPGRKTLVQMQQHDLFGFGDDPGPMAS